MKNKFLTFSFDDGVTQDIRFMKLLDKYGMKGTFNLNSEFLGHEGAWHVEGVPINHTKSKPEDIRFLYEGHEVAAHTLTHPFLPDLSREEIIRQVEEDRLKLSELCGYEVVGFAYPNGGKNYSDFVSETIKESTGIKYARTIISTYSFDAQENLYQFHPTAWNHGDADKIFELGKQFLELKSDEKKIFYVWGHTYEFDANDSWKRMEEFLEMMSGRDDISYCTNKEALLG
ncbi:MAG: polysaccharide deacetylase family protein [Clostridia bacterium]|nr:polysaccharide deacetylase family protein [Clostridia bacterium]